MGAMRIRLVAFASAADALGAAEMEVELAAGATVEELRRWLDQHHPALRPHWPRLAVAVDGRLAGPAADLPDGAEVALLPPVSGGVAAGGEVDGARDGDAATRLVDGPLDVAAAVARVRSAARGAVVTFLGTVRDHHRGRPVAKLLYDAYRPMAAVALARIAADLETRHEDLAVAIHHRLGEVAAGEPSVVIAVASPHREAAYAASRTALERLKAEVPIWKREHYADGEAAWREEEPLVAAAEPTR
jgi:molybdopterin synthase catalytic subunit